MVIVMAAIRSHLISLFSGGIFPDKKWWLSCFCLPHSKEEKAARQPSKSNERVIYTIHMNEDDQPKAEFDVRSIENSSIEKRGSDQLVSEIPLVNGCHVLLMEQIKETNYTRHISSNEYQEEECMSTVHEDSNANFPSLSDFKPNAEYCVVSSRKPGSSGTLIISNTEESFALEVEPNSRSDFISDEKESNKEQFTELLSVTESVSDGIVNGNVDHHQLSDTTIYATDKTVQNPVSYEKNLICASKSLVDLADQSFADFSKVSSDLETSGIQSNCEDTTLHLNSSCDNSYESIDDSDANIQITRILIADCEPSIVLENQCSTPEPPLCLKVENYDLLKLINEESNSSCSYGLDSSECVAGSLSQPVKTTNSSFLLDDNPSIELYNDKVEAIFGNKGPVKIGNCVVDEKLVQIGDHNYCVALRDSERKETDFGSDCFDHCSCQNNSDSYFSSYCDDFNKFDTECENRCEDRMVIPMVAEEHSKDPGCCATFEFELPSRRNDDTFSSNFTDINSSQTENASEIRDCCHDAVKSDIFSIKDGNKAVAVGKTNSSWNIEDLMEKDVVDPSSLLQRKLLFRSDSYEMLESTVKEQTVSLLNDALDQILLIKRTKENSFSHENSDYLQTNYHQVISHDDVGNKPIDIWNSVEFPLKSERDDPFLVSASNVFEEVFIGNYEQLSNSEEWLDDDFGFSSNFEEKLMLSYPDKVNDHPQQYSNVFLRLPELDCDDNGVLPELGVIQLVPEMIFPMVDQATDVFWSSRRYGEPWNEVHPPETYFTPEDYCGTLEDCSRKSHKTFVFDLVAEILKEIYRDELIEIPHPWQQVNSSRPKQMEEPPTTVDVLKPVVRNRVLQSLKRRKEHSFEKMKKFPRIRRQDNSRDFVDELLINEMYHEEPGWTDYSKDANVIKNLVANKLFFGLINDTAMVLKLLQSNYEKKYG